MSTQKMSRGESQHVSKQTSMKVKNRPNQVKACINHTTNNRNAWGLNRQITIAFENQVKWTFLV